jgi:signal recognition particle receptor subunit beta
MVVFNPLKREIDLKIVYYGPALCGKTTNLQSVHMSMNPRQRGELVSLATKDDRTLFFDFLPIELDSIKGFKTRFHIYTVPGQVFYTLTRRAVLTGVDGIIFVADSQKGKMEENIESFNDLKNNLKYYNKGLESIPFVIQYNKRDLDNIFSIEELGSQLNILDTPSFVATAINGKGVMETLTVCCKMVLKKIQDKSKTAKSAEIKESDKVEVEKAISQLPKLTLVEPEERQEAVGDIQQPLEEKVEGVTKPVDHLEEVTGEELKMEEGFGQVEKEEVEGVQEMIGKEEPLSEKQDEPLAVNDLLGEEAAGEQLSEPEPLVDEAKREFKEEILKDEPKIELEIPASAMDLKEEKSIGTVDASLPDETAELEDLEAEENKRTCPRCSLKFKSNVKQCPICKISLVTEGADEEKTGENELERMDGPSPDVESAIKEGAISVPEETGTGQGEQGLEIVTCGQPRKISSTEIRVPLIMKIRENDQEFKVNLAVSFEDFVLKPKE